MLVFLVIFLFTLNVVSGLAQRCLEGAPPPCGDGLALFLFRGLGVDGDIELALLVARLDLEEGNVLDIRASEEGLEGLTEELGGVLGTVDGFAVMGITLGGALKRGKGLAGPGLDGMGCVGEGGIYVVEGVDDLSAPDSGLGDLLETGLEAGLAAEAGSVYDEHVLARAGLLDEEDGIGHGHRTVELRRIRSLEGRSTDSAPVFRSRGDGLSCRRRCRRTSAGRGSAGRRPGGRARGCWRVPARH